MIAPVGLTIWLIWSVVGWIDGFVLPLVPKAYHPDRLLQDFLGLDPSMQFNVRGLGVVIFLIFTVMVGWAAKGLIGRSMIRFAESLVERTPVVRTIYSGIKQISETIFAQSERSFETPGAASGRLALSRPKPRERSWPGQTRGARCSRSFCRRRRTRPQAFCSSCRARM